MNDEFLKLNKPPFSKGQRLVLDDHGAGITLTNATEVDIAEAMFRAGQLNSGKRRQTLTSEDYGTPYLPNKTELKDD